MMIRLAVIAAFVSTLLLPNLAVAQVADLGQYLVGKAAYYPPMVVNPTGREMFALMIIYESDGDLDIDWPDTDAGGCESAVIPPHGTDDGLFDDNYPNGDEYRTLYELIAVPTDTGEFDRRGRSMIGVYAQGRKNRRGKAIRPGFFRLPTGSDRTALIDCACTELSDWGQPSDLLARVGITCPPPLQK